MLMDNHLHTLFSDGHNTLRSMAETAVQLGYRQITFTDHIRRSSSWIETYILEIEQLQKEFSDYLVIDIGAEAKIINPDGEIDFNPQYRDRLKIILAAIHRIPLGNDEYFRTAEITQNNKDRVLTSVESAMLNVMKNPLVDVLAHPFSLGQNQFFSAFFSREFCTRLKSAALSEGKYLEYNTSKYNDCVTESFWQSPGLKVWIGSDSHSVESMISSKNLICRICSVI
ncbi:PHP domain-containing protein [Breznakiella homolactica]|uniref:PHP domain-containing protein n=1 Tax=Breznakiella homolactica TaxID=2798577 RepID=A0A7T7XNX3_9SPIR|nr:PHP domain-containing protein [Breznakiella homolactica]